MLYVVVHNELGGSQPARLIANGRYLLIREIASGGMGKVWEGRDSRLGRTVAIKELSLDLIPPAKHAEFVERAIEEGRNAAGLADHPNIVTVYDVVVEDGSPWTVMQFVRGSSLGDLLKSGPPPVETVASMARQILSAIRHVHNAGIIHRDIKPHNIMINADDGRALLTDFGIAKNNRSDSLTRTGFIIGSVPYMAPERQMGQSGNPASDLFSLGVTLFEALEGYKPFGGGSEAGAVTGILASPLPHMQRGGFLIPLVRALTEKDPRNRPTAEQAIGMLNEAPVNLSSTKFDQSLVAAGMAAVAGGGTALNSEIFIPAAGLRGPGTSRGNRKKGLLVAGSIVVVVLASTAGGAYTYRQGWFGSHTSADGSAGRSSTSGSSSSDNSTTGSGLSYRDPGCKAALSDINSGTQALALNNNTDAADALNAIKAIGSTLVTDSAKSTNPAAARAIKKLGDDYIAVAKVGGSGLAPDYKSLQADTTTMGTVCAGS